MNKRTSRGFKMPYLEAIQKIPGNTASEKYSWIGRLASCQSNAIGNLEQFSPELLPLLLVEVAVKHKRHEDITSALISDNPTIVHRALKASWFFDGEHETVNIKYFCERIFPFVSLRTRNRIVKTLARRIKNPMFAQEMFTTVVSTYNVVTALPLFVACNNIFIFQTLDKMNLLLPLKIFKKIFYKNPKFGLSLFQFFIFSYVRFVPELGDILEKYKYFLPNLMKNNPLAYVRINIFSSGNSQKYILTFVSNTCAKRFLQGALEHVILNLELYYIILPQRIFNAVLIKKFPALVNQSSLHEYYKNNLMDILLMHPKERNLNLHLKIYEDICNGEFDNVENVTPLVLRLLPVKKRIELARKKKNSDTSHESIHSSTAWICYFPIRKAILYIKLKLNQTNDFWGKLQYLLEMIYACEVNNDENELYNTLKYIVEKGYLVSGNIEIYKEAIRNIIFASKPIYLSERNGFLIFHIIQMFYERYGYVTQDVLFAIILHRQICNKSIEDLIEILLKTNENYTPITIIRFVPQQYLQYYRKFLLDFINVIEQKYAISWKEKLHQEVVKKQTRKQQRQKSKREKNHSTEEQGKLRKEIKYRYIVSIQEEKSKNEEKYVLYRSFVAIYDFNEKYKKFGVQLMSIKDYPWLINAICIIMRSETNFILRKTIRIILCKYEPELYRRWLLPNTSKNIENIASGAALRLLKENFQSVLDNWEEYLTDCKRHYRHKHVQRFVRATRWYKDIPIKFAERCISDLHGEDTKEMSSALIILSLLLDGNSLVKLIHSFIFAHLKNGIDKHSFVRVLHFAKKFSNLLESF